MKPTLRLILSIFCLSLVFGLNAQTSSVTNSTPGSATFTVPFGVTQITVEVWGAGGAGGTIEGNGNNYRRGTGGGGGGAYARKVISVTPCQNISYTVGAGANPGSEGGDSWFFNATTVMAKGGLSASGYSSSEGASGGSATASIGDFKYNGGNGANGTTSTDNGGGGGSSAGNGSNGNSGSGSSGGIAPAGGGTGGNGRTGSDGPGSNGVSPGGGGGGASKTVNNTIQTGGNGGDGQVKISYNTVQFNPPTANNGTNATCNSFSANWTTSSGATTYFLDVSIVNTFASFVSGYNNLNVGNVTTRSIAGLTTGTTYYYRVRAANSCSASGNSGIITYATLSAPAVPTAIAGSNAACTSISANWNASANATGYRLDVSTVNTFASFVSGYNNLDVGNVTTRSIAGLTAGTTYYFRVRASNSCNTSGNSGTITYATLSAPAVPTAIAGSNAACTSISANWNASANAITYFLDVSTVNTFATFVSGYNNLDVGNVTTRSITGLASGTSYYYRVRASNSCSTSGNSGTITFATLSGTPAIPGIINGSISQNPSSTAQIYSIAAVPNATTYSWTVPEGWIITAGAATSSITVTTGVSGGNITVTAGNTCGRSAASSLEVSINPCSIDFDGVDDYLSRVSFINGFNDVTIMAWIKSDTGNSSDMVIAGEDTGCKLWLKNGNKPMFTIKSAGNNEKSVSGDHIDLNKWNHIAGTYTSATGLIKLYVNGELVSSYTVSNTGGLIENTSSSLGTFEIGRLSSNIVNKEYFKGDIDEVRVFNTALTDSQLQQIIYQEIENNNGNVRGTIIPKDISDIDTKAVLSWSNLKLYYRMGTEFTTDKKVKDYSGNGNHASIFNVTTSQEETAPMPYVTTSNGDWNTASTWMFGDVWDIKDKNNNKEFSIVRISNDITINQSLKTRALIIDDGKTLTVIGDNEIQNSWYLELNGTIDLKNDSQLIQTRTSDLVTSANGKLLRRQEGTSNAFRYNYWSSPVGIKGATSLIDNNASTGNTNNSDFKLNMLKDEVGFDMPFTSLYNQAGKISTYWLYTFKNGVTYWDWSLLSPTAAFTPGIGYTQKGTGNAGLQQQYIFEGKPNNGTILISVTDKGGPGSVTSVSKTEFLLGNPYPSALDIHKFIDDNQGVIGGTLQLWQQWAGDSHYLDEYKGGYAQVNKLGAVRASQFVGLYGATTGKSEGTMPPSKYLPVGQGFITEIIATGTVKFNNSQRVFIKEADADGTYNNGSVFLKSSNTKSKGTSTTSKEQSSEMQKIRLEFNSVVGPQTRREVLLGFSDMTTDGYDYGYDAECGESSNNDFNLSLDGKSMNMLAYSAITADKIIPLNFKSSANNTFEINATEFENMDEIQNVYLRDNVTGTYFDLKQNAAYRFSSTAGKFNNRFEMVFQSESKLLGTAESKVDENFIYYQNTTKTLFGKKLKTSIDKLSIVNMRGQTVQEFNNVSQETLNNGLKLNNMASGAYVAWFKAQTGQVITKKIIVN